MAIDLKRIRNIGVVAHIDAGKTTVTEQMLFCAGFIHKVGMVDEGTTTTDSDVEEQERGITIYSACVHFPWREVAINLIDTPGHVDFTAEVERSLRVLDGAVVVFSAREGVEAQSETVWRQADRYQVPRIAFINKMDREGADFEGTLHEIEERLHCKPVALTLPIGSGPPHFQNPFRGLVDLIEMKQLTFSRQGKRPEMHVEELPEELRVEAEMWRGELLDQLSLLSDELTELLLSEQAVPVEVIRRALRDATVHNMLVPVLCGSALDGIGVEPVLDAVAWYLPNPLDVPPVEGVDPGKPDKKLTRKPSADEPFAGLVFKIVADKHGDLHYVRVYSGELKAGSRVLNPGKEKKENVPQLWRIQADRRSQVERVEAGDIIGIIGLRSTITGDTICDTRHPILLESITFPETVVSRAIEPETSVERKKLSEALEMLKRQDPTFRVLERENETLISGMGELHLEVVVHRLLRDFNLNVRVHNPRVSYRETIERPVEVTGECHRTMAGQSLFGRLRIRMEPYREGTKPVTVASAVPPGTLPEPLLRAALEELGDRATSTGYLGFPLMAVKIVVLGGEASESESNEMAFRIAAGDAFNRGLDEAGPVLLEPIMKLEISTPEEFLGDFIADLQQRRAIINRTHVRGKTTVIEAQAPLKELFGYSNDMRGMSQGRATCTMEPLTYGPAPPDVRQSFM